MKDKHKTQLVSKEIQKERSVRFLEDVRIPCDLCEFTSGTAREYQRHIEIKHGFNSDYKVVKCDQCDFTTRNDENLNLHIKRVHPKKYRCEYCSYISNNIENVREHSLRTHKEETGAKVNGFQRDTNKSYQQVRPCNFFNRGFCKFSANQCRYDHVQKPECRYN